MDQFVLWLSFPPPARIPSEIQHSQRGNVKRDGECLGASGLLVTLLEQLSQMGCPLCPLYVQAECLTGKCSFSVFSHANEFLMVFCSDAACKCLFLLPWGPWSKPACQSFCLAFVWRLFPCRRGAAVQTGRGPPATSISSSGVPQGAAVNPSSSSSSGSSAGPLCVCP